MMGGQVSLASDCSLEGGVNEETGDTSDFRCGMHSQGWGGGKGKNWVCKDHVLLSPIAASSCPLD